MNSDMENKCVKILLMDGDPEASDLIKGMLEEIKETRFHLVCAGKLQNGLKYLVNEHFDVVLMDLYLPDSQGLDTLTMTKSHAPGVPIIVLSNLNDKVIAIKAVQQGAQDYLLKGHMHSEMIQRVIRYAIERKQAEQELIRNNAELQEMKMKYQAILRSTPNGLCMLSSNWHILWANEAMDKILSPAGSASRLDLEIPFSVLFPDGESFQRYKRSVQNSFRTTGLNLQELQLVNGDKAPFIAEISIVRLDPSQTSGGFVATISDITERKRAEEAMKAAERQLAEQRVLSVRSDRLRSLGEMATGMAHELNQPLVGIRGLAEHLLLSMDRGWEITEEKGREKLKLIIQQSDRMTHIIEHIRMFAREAGQPDLNPVQVNDVIKSSIDLLGTHFRNRGLDLKCELKENLPLILANPFSLEEVVLNLMANARDAVEERKEKDYTYVPGEIILRTLFVVKDNVSWVKIQVEDQGIGIPADIIPKVFDPFFTTKSSDKGTGLGLSISKSIVEELGGYMEIRSSEGEGTTVSVYLPVNNTQGQK